MKQKFKFLAITAHHNICAMTHSLYNGADFIRDCSGKFGWLLTASLAVWLATLGAWPRAADKVSIIATL